MGWIRFACILGIAGMVGTDAWAQGSPPSLNLEWIVRGGAGPTSETRNRIDLVFRAAWTRLKQEPRLSRVAQGSDRIAVIWDESWEGMAAYYSPLERGTDGRPAIVLNPRSAPGSNRLESMVIHEWTHLLHHASAPDEEGWVKEGLSLLLEWKLTAVLPSTFVDGMRRPLTSLTAPLDLSELGRRASAEIFAQYGHVFLFFAYLDKTCLSDAGWEKLFYSPGGLRGMALIEAVLRESGSRDPVCQSGEAFFRAFQRARLFPSPVSYSRFIVPSGVRAEILSARPATLPPYSAIGYRIASGGQCSGADLLVSATECLAVQWGTVNAPNPRRRGSPTRIRR